MRFRLRCLRVLIDQAVEDLPAADAYRGEVNLRAVTVTPGSAAQIGVVRHGLALLGRTDVRIGAFNVAHPKTCVSPWHYRALGEVAPSLDAEPGAQVLVEVCDEQTTLVCGAPLKNLGAAIADGRLRVGQLVAQGGFAGEGVIPPGEQLPKFRGRSTCPSYNLNGDPARRWPPWRIRVSASGGSCPRTCVTAWSTTRTSTTESARPRTATRRWR